MKKDNSKLVMIFVIAATGGLVIYLWTKNKKQARLGQQQGGSSSSGLGSSVPLQDVALNPVEQPNNFASTPVIQNYTESTTNVSSTPVSQAFFGSPPWHGPVSRPTSPHVTPSGRG